MRVDVPEYNTFIDFPEGTTPEVITKAMSDNFPEKTPPPAPSKSISENISDFGTGLNRGLAKLAGGIGQRVGAYSQADIDAALSAMSQEKKGEGFSGKAGEFIGETAPTFLIPGGGVTGGIARKILTSGISGAIQGAVQPTGSKDSVGMNIATGAVMGGATSGLMSGIGKGINAVTGRVEKNAVDKMSQKYGVRTTLGESLDNPIIKKSETWLEGVPVIGLKNFRKAQNEEAKATANDLLSHYIIDPASPDIAVTNRKFASNLFEDLKSKVQGITDQQIKPTETKAIAKTFLEQYPDIFKKFQDTKREAILRDMATGTADKVIPETSNISPILDYLGREVKTTTPGKVEPKTLTFNEAWTLRDGLGEMIGQARKKVANGEIDQTTLGQLKRLYASVNNDIDRWGASINRPDVRKAINTANDAYKTYVVKYDTIDRAMAVMNKAEAQGKIFSPQLFANALTNITEKNKRSARFTPAEIKEMTGVANIMHVVQRAGQYIENPATGARTGMLGALTSAEGLAYFAGGVGASVKTAGGVIGVAGLARFLTGTEAGKSFVKAASTVQSDSPAMQKIIEQIYTQLPKVAASMAIPENTGGQ